MGAFTYQQNSYACGTVAVMNVANALGVKVSYERAKELAGTTSKDGTSRSGIIRALNLLEFSVTPYSTKNTQNALRWLWKWADTCPVVLLVDKNSHWVCASGRVGDKVIVVDSAPNFNKNENGVQPYAREELLQRWLHRRCYAIRVSK